MRVSAKMSEAADPFRREIDWTANWNGLRWEVVGLFESEWGVRFVQDAAIVHGVVYAYVDYAERPIRWSVERLAQQAGWQLTTLYTRLPEAEAIRRVRTSESVIRALASSTVVDAVGELVEDEARSQLWRFAFSVRRADGAHRVVVVGGIGSRIGVAEGDYVGGYGFGNAAQAHADIPLNFIDWARRVALQRGWDGATNLK